MSTRQLEASSLRNLDGACPGVSAGRRLLPIGLLLTLLALVVGCGGSGSTRPGTSQPTPGKAQTPVSSLYAASGPLAIGDAEGAVRPEDTAIAPDSERVDQGGRRFSLPVDGPPAVIDRFGAPRGRGMIHGGIDLQVVGGTEVRSICPGKVLESGISDAYGEHVVVDCGGGWTALLGYLGNRSTSTGLTVTSSTVIGRVDMELRFVHVELRLDGKPVDPEPLIRFGSESLATATTLAPPTRPVATATQSAGAGIETASPTSSSVQPATPSPTSLGPTPIPATSTGTTVPPTATPRPPTPTPRPPAATPTKTPRPGLQ